MLCGDGIASVKFSLPEQLHTIELLEIAGTDPKALAILQSTNATAGQQIWY